MAKSAAPTSSIPPATDTLRAYSRAEVADRLGISVASVGRMIDAGELRVFYPRGQGKGKPVRISEAALREVFDRAA
jgi:excisionase family DNA binding protein